MKEILTKALETLILNIANLFKIKSILSLSVVFALTVKFVDNTVPIEVYAPLATMVMAFFFNKDDKKLDK